MHNNVSVLVYTNEKGFNITYLTLPRVLDAFKNVVNNIYVVANKLPLKHNIQAVKHIDAGVEFSSTGSHFTQTLKNALNQIEEDYVLFLCDDYLFRSPVKQQTFKSIVSFIEDHKVDYFSFSSLCCCDIIIKNWKKPDVDISKYQLSGTLLEISANYRHLYSVQPCIWKKSSLIKILNYNPDITLWDMDNTAICNTKYKKRALNYETNMYEPNEDTELDYNFKNYTINHPPLTYNIDDRQVDSDFYVFDYGEVTRHGKLMETMTNTKRLTLEYIKQSQFLQEKLKNYL